MPSRISSCVIGIDVGGTNTVSDKCQFLQQHILINLQDAVILQNENVLAWHKTPTTPDIQDGVEQAITAVIKSAQISKDSIDFIKIGTTVSHSCQACPFPILSPRGQLKLLTSVHFRFAVSSGCRQGKERDWCFS